MHFNMNGWEKPIIKLHAMLVNAEKNISAKPAPVLMIKGGHIKKPNAKGKGKWIGNKGKGAPNGKGKGPAKNQAPKAPQPPKNPNCYNYGDSNH